MIAAVFLDIDGGYTEWSEWSECTATCGGGSRSHSRTCTNPSPKNKGKTCIEQDLGPNMESEECNTQDCRKYNVFTSLHLLLLFLNIITKLCTVNMLLILACNTLVKGKFNCYKRSFSIFISEVEVAIMRTMFTSGNV